MAIIRLSELRKLSPEDSQKKLSELQIELAKERANIHIGAPVSSPGRIREIRKTIARMRTISAEKA